MSTPNNNATTTSSVAKTVSFRGRSGVPSAVDHETVEDDIISSKNGAIEVEEDRGKDSENSDGDDDFEPSFLKKSFDIYLAPRPADFEGFRWTPALLIAVYAFLNDAVNWSLISPVLPFIKTNWFGTVKAAGKWNAYIKGMTMLGNIFLAVGVGMLSDRIGRRPTMVLVALFGFFCNILLYVCFPNPVPYMFAQGINGTLARTGWACIAAMMIDWYPKEDHRIRALSIFVAARMAATSTNLVEAAIPGGTDSGNVMIALLIAGGIGFVYSFHFIPETKPKTASRGRLSGKSSSSSGHDESSPLLFSGSATDPSDPKNSASSRGLNEDYESSVETEKATTRASEEPRSCWDHIKRVLRILVKIFKNPVLVLIILSQGFADAAWFGMADIINYYLINKIGWTKDDIALFDPLQNGFKVLFLLGLLPLLQRRLSEIGIIQLSNFMTLLFIITQATVVGPWMMYALAAPFGACAAFSSPPMRSLVADESDETERTINQATVLAAVDLFSGLAGLVFGYIWSSLAPWVLFLLAGILQVICMIITACLFKYVKPKKK